MNTLSYDFFFLLRGQVRPPEEIVIVAIDEESFGVLGLQWPWPRSLHAKLIDTLFNEGAQTVGFDLLFAETSKVEEDRILADAVARHPDVILAADISILEDRVYSRESIVGPHPLIAGPLTSLGTINLPVEPDSFIRRFNLSHHEIEPMALAAAKRFLKNKFEFPSTSSGWINYFGPARTVKIISYYQALESTEHLPRGFFNGKLVLVGFCTQNISEIGNARPDHFPVPFSRWKGGYMSGVEIHANLAANLIRRNTIDVFPVFETILIGILPWFVSGFVLFRRKPAMGALILLFFCFFILATAFLLFSRKFIYLPFIYLLIPMISLYVASPFVHYFEGRREKNFIRKAFSTYVAPSVVKQLIEFPDQLKLGGEEREITAFFSDVEGFSSISERLSPTMLVELLNEFLTEMTDIILNHKGTVDKFEGDAIIAMFGAPNTLENHAESACKASIAMQARLAELRKGWKLRALPELKMRIGLCSGKAVVGNMGSKNRMDYTMMGDTVNIAARLESANKIYGTYTLLGQSTYLLAGKDITVRELDSIQLMGKKEPVFTYELLGQTGKVPDRLLETVERYSRGLEAYRHQSWRKAIEYFRNALAISPHDTPSSTMLNRCLEYQLNPPDKSWNGTYTMDRK